jgi:hypothetical protein
MYHGVFDGRGRKIIGLYINQSSEEKIGLFANVFLIRDDECLKDGFCAVIKNIVLENIEIYGRSYVGGLVGHNSGAGIENISVHGIIVGDKYVGGLVGYNSRGHISNYVAGVSVFGKASVGGLVGYLETANLTNSATSGSVIGYGGIHISQGNIGGLVGKATKTCGISNCFSTAKVSGNTHSVGGLVGSNGGLIRNSYATGDVNASSPDPFYAVTGAGGLVGGNGGVIIKSYSSGQVNGNSWVGGLVGSNDGHISECYSLGDVTGVSNIGGFVGGDSGGGGDYSIIDNSYSRGNVKGSSGEIGGFIGYIESDVKIINSYSIGYVTGGVENPRGGVAGDTDVGGFGGQITTVQDSFSVGKVSKGELMGALAGLAGSEVKVNGFYYANQAGNPDSCYTIVSRIPGSVMAGPIFTKSNEGCTMADKNTFFSSLNPPLNKWDFTNIWKEKAGDYPVFKWQE